MDTKHKTFKILHKQVEFLCKRISSRLKVSYKDVYAECYIFYDILYNNLVKKNFNPEDKQFTSMLYVNYYKYTLPRLYRIFTNEKSCVKIPKSLYENFVRDLRNSSTNEEVIQNFMSVDIDEDMLDNNIFEDNSTQEQIDLDILLSKLKEILTDKEYTIVEMLNDNYNQSEIADKLGVTRQRISMIMKDIREKLVKNKINY